MTEKERLIELLNDKTKPWHYLLCPSIIKLLAEYLLKNGVIVPPYDKDNIQEIELTYNKPSVINDEELIPTAVTMCKDCTHYKFKGYDPLINKQFGVCDEHREEVLENDFCSFACKKQSYVSKSYNSKGYPASVTIRMDDGEEITYKR